MDRAKAAALLGVKEDASKDEILKRYNVLIRKHKMEPMADNSVMDEVTTAYNLLMGYNFIDPLALERKRQRQQNPNKLLKKLNIDEDKAENFMHYYKWHMIITAIVLVIVVFSVRGCINQIPSDLNIDFIGEIYNVAEDQDALKKAILEKMPQIHETAIQYITLSPDMDGQMAYSLQMKIMVEMAAAEVDVFIMDEAVFRQYSENGAFMALEEVLNGIEGVDSTKHVNSALTERDTEGKITNKEEERIYGIDISDSAVLKENGIYGESMIFTIGVKAKHLDSAIELLYILAASE